MSMRFLRRGVSKLRDTELQQTGKEQAHQAHFRCQESAYQKARNGRGEQPKKL
jgi:hypothetical protein